MRQLQVNVSMVTSRLGLVRESLRSSALLLRQPIRELQSLANVPTPHTCSYCILWDVSGRTAALRGAELQAVSTHSVLQGALQGAELQASKLQEAEHRSQRLMERMKPLSMLGETLSRNLSRLDRNTVMHIGGLGSHTQGCVGEASLNERNIGLWNYERREGECGGCFSSPQTEETSFHFDGSGFSLVQKSLRATSTSIVLLFKTLSPGGLLLYLASNNTRDFLSMELVGGRVRLTFDLGSGALILTSNRKYNSGVWYKITLQRSKRKGYLSIMAADQSSEKEVLEAESPGTASDLNRSDLDPIYIGGLPASRPIRRYEVSLYSLEDRPPSLGQEAELLFSFSSNNQSGVLLAAFSDDKSQRSISCRSTCSQCIGGGARGSGRSFSEGDGGDLTEEREESRLPIRVQGLSRRFRGCIQHLVVGGALVDLSGALKYEGAELDSCLLEKVEVAVLPDDQEVQPTPDPAHLPGAPPTHLSAFTPGALTEPGSGWSAGLAL
ncbi:hypothetical protein F7725_014822 [Dissostichus mawsoni]|uniref:Laminin G domain-containing protein n=1 Tax=Dissostichus mawsoni TaxID=36200 RepID=A0A7J5YFX9_DISMA|nr:hypothetical protein F7725_014822 [Dissostichus mawsoni]